MFSNRFSCFEMHSKNGGFLQLAMKPKNQFSMNVLTEERLLLMTTISFLLLKIHKCIIYEVVIF